MPRDYAEIWEQFLVLYYRSVLPEFNVLLKSNSEPAGLRRRPRLCISNKLPSDALMLSIECVVTDLIRYSSETYQVSRCYLGTPRNFLKRSKSHYNCSKLVESMLMFWPAVPPFHPQIHSKISCMCITGSQLPHPPPQSVN